MREAMAMGLDRDDTVIRRRLRQKLEFVVEDVVAAAPPTEQELQAWLAGHADAFRIEPQVAFRQVYVSRDRRGAAAETDARALLARLRAGGPRGADRRPRRPDHAAAGGRSLLARRRRPDVRRRLRRAHRDARPRDVGRSHPIRLRAAPGAGARARRGVAPRPRPGPSGRGARVRVRPAHAAARRDVRAAAREVQGRDREEDAKATSPPAGRGRAARDAPSPLVAAARGSRCSRSARRAPRSPRNPPRLPRAARERSDHLLAALEAADRRRGRDPDRARGPGGLPPLVTRPAAAHAGRRAGARHADLRGRAGGQDAAHRGARDHDHRRAGARPPRRRPAGEPHAPPGDAVGDAGRR